MAACHWRAFVMDGQKYQSIQDFPDHYCVLISPRIARYQHNLPDFLPYFNVPVDVRRRIFARFHGYTPQQHIRHHCLFTSQFDSRGLCINPKHLTIGTLHMNHDDAIKEAMERDQQGYLTPQHDVRQRPLQTDPVPLQPGIKLSEVEMKQMQQCEYFYQHEQCHDKLYIDTAQTLLEALRDNLPSVVEACATVIKQIPHIRLNSCQWHRRRKPHGSPEDINIIKQFF
jgi:hypothetical protein